MKLFKKLTAIILTLTMLCTMSITSFSATETVSYVDLPTDGTAISSEFTQAGETHYYKITLEGCRGMSISIQKDTNSDTRMTARIYEEDMTCISQDLIYNDDDLNYDEMGYSLVDGIYYLSLTTDNDCIYNIKCRATKRTDIDVVNNNHFTTAYELKENESVIGRISINDRTDVYKMVLAERKKVEFYTANTVADIPSLGIYYELYEDTPNRTNGKSYGRISKEKCYYYIYEEGSGAEYYDTEFFYDDHFWWGYDSMVLDAGIYYFVFQSKYLDETGQYRIMYKTAEPDPVLNIKYENNFNAKSQSVEIGKHLIFECVDGKVKRWKISDNNILKLSEKNGLTYVYGRQKGTAKVTAILNNGKKLTCKIKVTGTPKFFKKNKTITSISVKKGNTVKVFLKGAISKKNIKCTKGKTATIKIGSYSYKWGKDLYELKVKGLKKGTSHIKIKVNGVKTLKLKVKVK